MSVEPWFRRRTVVAATVLAVLAYLPALTAAPGRMPSDSKLYLYLDPGRFLGDAASTFDARQFGGWVPHQHIAYLWPSGPWYWVLETFGVPDWIAHRLWIGTLMLAAGLGARWLARLLGLTPHAALTVAVVYQLSLYVLPYVSRTSVMLLPWAGLGWIIAFTIRSARRGGWADPAALALIVFTVGAVNATALAMITPGPVLLLVHLAWQRTVTWRAALAAGARIGALCLAVSIWWIAMLLVQSRFGTDVLPYSESLGDVSLTSTAPEVWRTLGYWLFYIRDPYAAATAESLRYLSSSWSIALSYVLPLLALSSIAFVSWTHRRFAALLVGTGLVLAVGVHPIDDRSPLMALLAGDDESGLALALRSSTRALPLVALGSALAIGAGVDAFRSTDLPVVGSRARPLAAGLVCLIAVANLPSLWTGGFVDPALERDEHPPDAWLDAAERLDEVGTDARVLQIPGAEFGAFRWGYTVDQPLPGLTDKPLVTRDLLPLGSAGAMDLLFAFDDRVQDGTLDEAALAPSAALLGADTVWLANDLAFDRFRTARPEIIRDEVVGAPGVASVEAFGDPVANRPDVPVVDERALGDPRVGRPASPVELVRLDVTGAVVRARAAELFVAGSGDGLVDAAAAGLLAPGATALRYTADLDDPADLDDAVALVVTDSNRDRARHWRSSQDTVGYTEPGGDRQDVLRPVASDVGLEVFGTDSPERQTVAEQIGPVTAAATSYGEPFAYLPEHRPFAAIDGDPDTAWIVGEHGDPLGESIRLTADEPLDRLMLHQPRSVNDRRIASVAFTTTDEAGDVRQGTIDLDESSWNGSGQEVRFDRFVEVEMTIVAVEGGVPFTGSVVAGVGFAEIEHGLGSTVEIVTPPQRALGAAPADLPVALSFTRLRHDPMDRWRDDTEPTIVRGFGLPTERTFTVTPTVRIDARAHDRALAELFGWEAVASTRLTGAPRHAGVAALDGDDATAWITAFGEATGATLSTVAAQQIDEIEIRQPESGTSVVTEVTVRGSGVESLVSLSEPEPGVGIARGRVEPPVPAGEVDVVLSVIEPEVTIDRRFGDPVELPAVIDEIVFDGRPAVAPIGSRVGVTAECVPLASIDGITISASITVIDDGWLDGEPIAAEPCQTELTLEAGDHLVAGTEPVLPIALDRLVLDDGVDERLARLTDSDTPQADVIDGDRLSREIVVTDCPDGCWLILGEGFNHAWSASTGGTDLGPPTLLDGGFNGWWLDGGDSQTVDVRWTAQRTLDWAFGLTLIGIAIALFLIVRDRVGHDGVPVVSVEVARPPALVPERTWTTPALVAAAVGLVIGAGLLITPTWAVWGAAIAGALFLVRRHRLPELTALATVAVIAVVVTVRERRIAPPPNGAWPGTFESLHRLGMLAIVCVLVAALVADDADGTPDTDDHADDDRLGQYPR